MTRKTSVVLALPLLFLPIGSAVSSAQGIPADSVLRGFQPSGEDMLLVNGHLVPGAEIYRNEQVPAVLVLTSALPSPVLLTPGSGSVSTVHIMKIAKQKDGSVDLLADAVLAPIGKLEFESGDVRFTYGGRQVSLKPKPPLLGLQTSSALKKHSPEYLRGSTEYKPNGAAITALKKEPSPVRVRVIFGSWCPHCRQHVPFILRVEDELKGSKIKFEYFGLPKPPDAWQHPEVKRLGVKGVPTGIVYMGGKEVGRILNDGWDAPEVQLNKIVHGPLAKGK